MVLKLEVLVRTCDPCTAGSQKTRAGILPGGPQQVTRISAGREERQKAREWKENPAEGRTYKDGERLKTCPGTF